MKCAACGYEYIHEVRQVDDVVYFKSGKNKGKIKEVKKKDIEFNVGHEPFEEMIFAKEVDSLVIRDKLFWGSSSPVYLYLCPDCGTIRGEWQ